MVHRRGDRQRAALARGRGALVEYLAFRLGSDTYAVPVATIREIVRPPPIAPVPRAPHAVIGIMSGRGRVVTVLDARKKLRLPEGPLGGRARILVTETGTERIGLLVDEVLMVYRLAESEIERTAPSMGSDVADYIAGVARPTETRFDAGGHAWTDHLRTSATSVDGREQPGEELVLILLDLRALLAAN